MKSHKPKQKVIGNYRVDKVLGKGSYGTVRLGIHKDTGSKVKNQHISQSLFKNHTTVLSL
jgi:serine/threonine protein kinase